MSDWTFAPAQETPLKRLLKAFFWGSVAGALVATIALTAQRPSCPTEDSCKAVYENGTYKIKEVTP